MLNLIKVFVNQRKMLLAGIASILLPVAGYVFTSTGAVTYAKLGIDVVCDLPVDKRVEITNNIKEALGGHSIELHCKNDLPVISIQPYAPVIGVAPVDVNEMLIPARGVR